MAPKKKSATKSPARDMTPKPVLIRLPSYLVDAIDSAIAEKPVKISRAKWIAELVVRELKL